MTAGVPEIALEDLCDMQGVVAASAHVSTVLPEDAARWLVEAAAVRNTSDNRNARTRAVDRAMDRIKEKYPGALIDS